MFVLDEVILVAAAEMRRATGYAQAQELRAIAEFARRHVEDEFAYLEIATRLHISDRAAQQRMRFALEVVDRLPRTLNVLLDGQIEEYKAQLIADAVRCLTDEQAHAVEARVLPDAAEQTPAQLRAALAKAVMMVDPEGAEERRQLKKADRRVCSQPTEDGEAVLSIYHSAAKIAAMRAAIRGQALQLKNTGGELRTLAQLEADVAADLILGSEEHHKVEVHLTLPIGQGDQPAEVDGVGSITAQAARELAAEATSWRWLRTDPETGAVVDLTAPSYTPPAALAEFVKVRDRTCRFPGCTRPARTGCDVDHRTPGRRARPAPATAPACAGATTAPKPTAAGASNRSTRVSCGGPAHWATCAWSNPPRSPNPNPRRRTRIPHLLIISKFD